MTLMITLQDSDRDIENTIKKGCCFPVFSQRNGLLSISKGLFTNDVIIWGAGGVCQIMTVDDIGGKLSISDDTLHSKLFLYVVTDAK